MKRKPPIEHWSYSSLMAFLRNPLAWYKRYVEGVYDTPSSPSSFIGRAGHVALEHFYKGVAKEEAILSGLNYLKNIQDIEINFGKAQSKRAKKMKRAGMERGYQQAISFYLARPPRHKVLGVEINALAKIKGLPLPLKAVSDLVVQSRIDQNAIDIIDHKFVDSWSSYGRGKTLFILQAMFNYYTVREAFKKPVRRFVVYECKKSRNKDGSSQMRRYIINFEDCAEEFVLFRKLINDATKEITRRRLYLPNPSDMFEGENSFDIYRLGLVGE
ncbi:PD-(D/E)XK nuclease family protein [Candidatus Kaiserbacteria bacterium]|nr:PD-(D/E)XK nuclease family protein [Candidatus Kaiserbacteria bacterium]